MESPFNQALIFTDAVKKWANKANLGEEVNSLVRKLEEIDLLINRADNYKLTNPYTSEILSKFKLVISDANDLLSELNYFRLQDIVENKHNYHNRHSRPHSFIRNKISFVKRSCASLQSVLVIETNRSVPVLKLVRADMSRKIKRVLNSPVQTGEDVEKALELETPYHFGNKDIGLNLKAPDEYSLVDASKVFGRKEEKHYVVQVLTGQNSGENNSLLILPIVGNGGVGKTTLTRIVYNDCRVKLYFNERIWLRVSSTFDVQKLTNEILEFIFNGNYHLRENLNTMQEIIRGELISKRILLVIDNLSDDVSISQWNSLIAPLGTASAKIVVTTRFRSIVEKVGAENYMELDGLKGKDRWALFKSCIFGDKNPEEDLLDIGKRIMKKLKGYPLEVKTISRVLKQDLDSEHWNEILESDEWKRTNELGYADEHIMSSLEINFRRLSRSMHYDLQKCISFCTLLLKREKFRGDDLISSLISLDFISATNGIKSEISGRQALKELVSQGFLQEITNFEHPRDNYYIMHELRHDLVKMVSAREFLTIDSNFKEGNDTVHYLSIVTPFSSDNRVDEGFVNKLKEKVKGLEIEKLRALMLIGRYDENFAQTFRNLFGNTYYLHLIRLSMESFPVEYLLPNISNSPILKYVKLESGYSNPSSCVQELTDNSIISLRALSRLYQLRTLDISELHHDCNFRDFNLVSLRHIRARGTQVAMISEIGKPNSIEELREFTVHKETGYDIGQLGEFTNLRGSIKFLNLENIDSKEEALKEKLVEKHNLETCLYIVVKVDLTFHLKDINIFLRDFNHFPK